MSEKGDNSAKYLQNFAKNSPGHLHIRRNLGAKFNDPSSSGSPVNLLTRLHRFTMHKSKKGITLSTFPRILGHLYDIRKQYA